MRLPFVLALALVGCAASVKPAAPGVVPVVASSTPTALESSAIPARRVGLTPEQALKECEKTFADLQGHSASDVARASAKLLASGLDEERTLELIEGLMSQCLAGDDPCKGFGPGDRLDTVSASVEQLDHLFEQLAAVGSEQSLPLLVRLDARGVYPAERIIERVLVARSQMMAPRCVAPSADEVASQRAMLSDFAVVEHDGKRWLARASTSQELDDLAYLLAAVAEAGPPVGNTRESAPSPTGQQASATEQRKRWRAVAQAAWLRGDVASHADAARAWLASLGFPGPLRAEEDGEMTWGGAAHSYVMRELARSAEILGQWDDAAALYRRANPGGGGCGTSVPTRRATQMRGLVRTTEQALGCRPVVPERLYAMSGYQEEPYGPERLAASGFDLARLYRGAALTWGRDIDPAQLAVALASAPGRLAADSVTRLQVRGPEAWDSRVRALEGLADTAGKAGLAKLLERARHGPVAERLRALRVLSRVAHDPGPDPCHPERSGGVSYSFGGSAERKVGSLNRRCETFLSTPERGGLVKELASMSRDSDPQLRAQVAVTLGRIGSLAAVNVLRTMLSDPHHPKGARTCITVDDKPQVCRDSWPVRDAAREALDTIARLRHR